VFLFFISFLSSDYIQGIKDTILISVTKYTVVGNDEDSVLT
jgi:hypothetical protein